MSLSLSIKVIPWLLAGAVLVSALGIGIWCFGSVWHTIAFLRGERFVVEPLEVNLGECESDARSAARFTVTNLSRRPVRVVGIETECNCVVTDEPPVTVAVGEKREIDLRVRLYGEGREFVQPVVFLVDDGELQSVVTHVRASIVLPKRTTEKDGTSGG